MEETETKAPMTFQDYWNEIIPECQSDLESTSDYPQAIFYAKFEDVLVENNVFSPMDFHYFETRTANKKYKLMHIDYGKVDAMDNSINLLTIDYDPLRISSITNEKCLEMYQKMLSFIVNICKGYFQENNLQSDPIYPFIKEIITALPTTDELNLFVLSSNVKSSALKDISPVAVKIGDKEINVTLKIIDIQYLFNSSLSTRRIDPVNINVADINDGQFNGIKCLEANVAGNEYKAYLAVLPGSFLSEIYRLYGGRLLEKNVRSFLSTRGGVNKGIRNTIRTEPEKFFTYNNGIACTASSIQTETRSDGLYITQFNDLQIINGGQTTASLRNAVLTDKDHIVDLNKVFVPMKLTVLDKSISDEDRDVMIGNISKYSNSQNKVSNSDLNSNSPFYVQLEKISRRLFTPTMINGYQTMWYFERSRGQYERDQMELSPAKRKRFKEIRPRNQVMRVVDIAKYYNAVVERPYKVAWGGQVNAEDFQIQMQKEYDKNSAFVNDNFFKNLVAYAILFLQAKEIVKKTQAYQEHTGILAESVAYTVSMLMHLVREQKRDLDWRDIWNKQDIPDALKEELNKLGSWVIGGLTDPGRPKDNVGEWAKLKDCWEGMCKRNYSLSNSTLEILVSPVEAKAQEWSARKEERQNQGLDNSLYVFKLGAEYWRNVLNAGYRYNKLTSDYNGEQCIQEAIRTCERNQLIHKNAILDTLMRIKKEYEEEGIIEKKEPSDSDIQ